MISSPAAKHYAKALFEAAKDAKALAFVWKDMQYVCKILSKEPGIIQYLQNPSTSREKMNQLLDTVFSSSVHQLTIHLLYLLVKKSRIALLLLIPERFETYYHEHQGIIKVRMVTAVPPCEKAKKIAISKMEKLLNQKVNMVFETNQNIIAGFQFIMNDKLVDYCVASQANQLRKILLAA